VNIKSEMQDIPEEENLFMTADYDLEQILIENML
jgi:hypothetical protein